jgi:phage-related protein
VSLALKPLAFIGTSQEDLRTFPSAVKQALGVELMVVQLGGMPADFKPMPSIGAGVYEIRVHLDGAWRAIYVSKHAEAIYVLHTFQKKTQKTSTPDLNIATARYRQLTQIHAQAKQKTTI